MFDYGAEWQRIGIGEGWGDRVLRGLSPDLGFVILRAVRNGCAVGIGVAADAAAEIY